MSLTAKIKAIISEQLNVETAACTREARFVDDLGADSLDVVELIVAFEDHFGIEISDEDLEKLYCVGDAIGYIESHLAFA